MKFQTYLAKNTKWKWANCNDLSSSFGLGWVRDDPSVSLGQIQPLARLLFNPNQQVLASVNSAFPTVRPKSMAGNASSPLTLVFLIILIAAPTPSGLIFPTPSLVSLGHSLMTRVANLRASRGDHSGAERARAVAATLERLELALGGMMWSTGWDYFRNYAWGEMNWRELNAAVSEMKELLRWVTELTRMNSDAERAAWVGRNYQSVLRVSNSMLGKLLQVFRQSVRFTGQY